MTNANTLSFAPHTLRNHHAQHIAHPRFAQRASERIGHDLIGDPSVSVLEVRDVSPKKLFMCLTFRVPLAVLERPAVKRKSAEEGAPVAAGADSKKARPEEKGDATK